MKNPVQLSLDQNNFLNGKKKTSVSHFNTDDIKKTLKQISKTCRGLYSHMFQALENEELVHFLVLDITYVEENGVVSRIVEMRDVRTNSLIPS